MLELLSLSEAATEVLDCLTCSACCRGHAGVIPVSAEDLVRFKRAGRPELAERVVPGHFGDEAMETRSNGACIHLGRPGLPHHCSIYEVRPAICGDFEARQLAVPRSTALRGTRDLNAASVQLATHNAASGRKIPEALGFISEGTLRGVSRDAEGCPCDVNVFSLLRDDYECGPPRPSASRARSISPAKT